MRIEQHVLVPLESALPAVDLFDRVHLDQPFALIRLDFDPVLTQLLDDCFKTALPDVRTRSSNTQRRLESASMDDRVMLPCLCSASPRVLDHRSV